MSVPMGNRVTCQCGAVEVWAMPGIKFTKLRCWRCPPEKPKPLLKVVT